MSESEVAANAKQFCAKTVDQILSNEGIRRERGKFGIKSRGKDEFDTHAFNQSQLLFETY